MKIWFIVKSKFVVDYLQHFEVLEFKRKKRAEEKAKLSRDAKDESYEDYPRTELCEDLTKLKDMVYCQIKVCGGLSSAF